MNPNPIVAFLKTHKTWLVTAGAGLVAFLTPSVNAYVSAHPGTAVTVGTLWGIATTWAKSPLQNQDKK